MKCKDEAKDPRIGTAYCDLELGHNGQHHDKEIGVVWAK